jgi:hypothetical protein
VLLQRTSPESPESGPQFGNPWWGASRSSRRRHASECIACRWGASIYTGSCVQPMTYPIDVTIQRERALCSPASHAANDNGRQQPAPQLVGYLQCRVWCSAAFIRRCCSHGSAGHVIHRVLCDRCPAGREISGICRREPPRLCHWASCWLSGGL